MAKTALGFTIKSGWACAVVLSGTERTPQVIDARRIELSDPADADARQPYHATFGTARKPGPRLEQLLDAVQRFGRRSVGDFIRDQQNSEPRLVGAGIVAGSLVDPATIGNEHIRIHALEGQLFRGIVSDAAARRPLPAAVWRERDLYDAAVERLKRSEPDIRQTVTALGRGREGPWRAEHKAAALAAWLVLAGSRGPGRGPGRGRP